MRTVIVLWRKKTTRRSFVPAGLLGFDDPAGAFDVRTGGVTFVMVASGLFTTLFFLWPAPLVAAAQAAVAALLG